MSLAPTITIRRGPHMRLMATQPLYSNHAPQMLPQVFPSSNHTMEPEVLETANQQGNGQRLRNRNP